MESDSCHLQSNTASDTMDIYHNEDPCLNMSNDYTNIIDKNTLNTTWTILTSDNNAPNCMGPLFS